MIIVGYSRKFASFVTPSLTGTPTTYFLDDTSEASPLNISHTSTTGNVLIRHVLRSNSNTTIVPNYDWNGVDMTNIVGSQSAPNVAGNCSCFAAIIRGGATGTNNLTVNRNTPMGNYCIRIDDIADLPVDWEGSSGSTRAPSAVNTINIALTSEAASSLILCCGGVVATQDAKHPIGVDGAWTVNSQLSSDTTPNTSAHTRAVFASKLGTTLGATEDVDMTTANAATDATFAGIIFELKGI